MGIKHPDQISPSDWRQGGETVGRMLARKWEIVGRCDACGVATLVDLRIVAIVKGQGFSLWNRKTPCRRLVFNGRCHGFVAFEFKAPGMTRHKRLAAPDRAPPR